MQRNQINIPRDIFLSPYAIPCASRLIASFFRRDQVHLGHNIYPRNLQIHHCGHGGEHTTEKLVSVLHELGFNKIGAAYADTHSIETLDKRWKERVVGVQLDLT